MKKQGKKKVKLNKSRILILAIIIAVALFVGISAKNIITLKMENAQLQQKNEQLEAERQKLKKEYKNIDKKEYVEKQAREVLKMVKPNEKLIIIEDDE